ncbi:hypothetical protein [Streptomyces sp. AP-93]|uniref:hypothetical protein n=1 Tax=Streptomyces sp. AP-93 TaxID=2929048 RepID=UPI001FAFD730|nr:hypothetical protein [Streptomyces sp. AP-93]MCJ0868098.1 hypothetical protein [Streptomyces sp. AP-93]
MDPEQISPLSPDPDLPESRGIALSADRHLNARQFGHGLEPRGADRSGVGTGAPTGYTLPHYGSTGESCVRPLGGEVNDDDNGLAPGCCTGPPGMITRGSDITFDYAERNIVSRPHHGARREDDEFADEAYRSLGHR